MHSLEEIKAINRSKARKLVDEAVKSGGVSFTADLNKLVFNDGYTVSISSVLKTKDKTKLETALNRLDKINSFYGLWLDEDEFNLDMNINVSNKTLAIALGKEFNQIAVWSEREERVILL